jgi:hypothetical protein
VKIKIYKLNPAIRSIFIFLKKKIKDAAIGAKKNIK